MFWIVESLSRVNVILIRGLMPILKEEGLSSTEIIVLWKVHKRGCYRTTDLAREIGVPASTFTGIFDRLVSRKLLERTNDPGDRRSVIVQGTPELKEFMKKITGQCNERLEELLKDVPEDFITQFTKDLQYIQEYLLHKERGD